MMRSIDFDVGGNKLAEIRIQAVAAEPGIISVNAKIEVETLTFVKSWVDHQWPIVGRRLL